MQAINVADLKANTVFHIEDPENNEYLQRFWKVVSEFDQTQLQALLKFATSCPRPPLLGFSQLNPKFSVIITNVSPESLPTSSTCVNLLRIPPYPDEFTMRKYVSCYWKLKLPRKLLYAITSQSGFYLS